MNSKREGLHHFDALKQTTMEPRKRHEIWSNIEATIQNSEESSGSSRPPRKRKMYIGSLVAAVVAVALVVVGLPYLWHQGQSKSNILAGQRAQNISNDNFSQQTMAKLTKFVQTVSATKLNFQAYEPTGGLQEADPFIEAWSDMSPYAIAITFSMPTGQCTVRESNKNSPSVTQVSWKVAGHVGSTTYYSSAAYSGVYLFYKGSTAFWIETISSPFPEGLVSHLAPIPSVNMPSVNIEVGDKITFNRVSGATYATMTEIPRKADQLVTYLNRNLQTAIVEGQYSANPELSGILANSVDVYNSQGTLEIEIVPYRTYTTSKLRNGTLTKTHEHLNKVIVSIPNHTPVIVESPSLYSLVSGNGWVNYFESSN